MQDMKCYASVNLCVYEQNLFSKRKSPLCDIAVLKVDFATTILL